MKPTVAGEADESADMVATQRVERDRTGRTDGVVRRAVGFYPNGGGFFNTENVGCRAVPAVF